MNVMRRYISLCQKQRPVVPRELSEHVVNCYVEMRREARNSKDASFTSARNLLAILRLATALTKLRLSNEVDQDDVMEALRLLEMSKISLKQTTITRYILFGNFKRIVEIGLRFIIFLLCTY